MNINDKKKEFLIEEVWLLSFGGAFQRAGIYKTGVNEKDRKEFRTFLRNYIENELIEEYKKGIEKEEIHIQNITKLSKKSKEFLPILNAEMNFGISQKLLNLILKYYWCLGILKVPPPHCPVDSIIQKKIPTKNRVAWTKMTSRDSYEKVIDCIREKVKPNSSIAQWELENFSRNQSKIK